MKIKEILTGAGIAALVAVVIPVICLSILILGALFGWFAVYVLSFIFTFDYELARTVGMVIGAISAFRASLAAKVD